MSNENFFVSYLKKNHLKYFCFSFLFLLTLCFSSALTHLSILKSNVSIDIVRIDSGLELGYSRESSLFY